MLSAPVFLIIYMDMEKCRKKYGEDNYKKDAYLNASASIENMLLKAVDLGLGSCYVTGFKEKELAACLNIDNNKEVIAILTLGYEDKTK
jgi:nitroreductase